MTTPFWLSNPTILFKQADIAQIWPMAQMTSEEKLNSITRLVILLTILGYLVTKTIKIVVTGLITLVAIGLLYQIQQGQLFRNKNKKLNLNKEGFTNPETYKNDFTPPSVVNPAMNVLLTEINDNPKRKTAAPSFNPAVEAEMNMKTKQFITNNFDNKTNIDERLFRDLGDSFAFDQSMRTWYSTPNTTVPNDQQSFAEYCYGDMVSCKEGDEFACTRNAPPHWIN
jgi:hypothetical protein